jgi:hypothetical protein
MANRITVKTLKHHVQCECGYNLVEQFNSNITIKELKSKNYKKRKFKDTKLTFYFNSCEILCNTCQDLMDTLIDKAMNENTK